MGTRIIYISHTKILGKNGGSLENFKHYVGLTRFCEKVNGKLTVLSLDEEISSKEFPQMRKTIAIDVLSRLAGHSTFVYIYWKMIRKRVYEYAPDIIVLGRTRMGFIARDVKKRLPKSLITINVENVESDFVNGYFAKTTGIIGSLKKRLEKQVVQRDEQLAYFYADHLTFLTERDQQRARDLYHFRCTSTVLPICLNDVDISPTGGQEPRIIAFLGSLGYQSNIEAIEWFIKNVWLPYYSMNSRVKLVVGGNGGSRKLSEYLQSINNCEFVGRYNKVQEVIDSSTIMIAPIRHGAGMKVKVAEALRLGIPIVASHEALAGYEECVSEASLGIIEANRPIEYYASLERLLAYSENEFRAIAFDNHNKFKKYYSLERSNKDIELIMSKLINEIIAASEVDHNGI